MTKLFMNKIKDKKYVDAYWCLDFNNILAFTGTYSFKYV